MSSFTSISEVDRIASFEDPVLRNLQITQSYYELSTVISRRTGICANWCTFATWASKQAGQTIRREDLQQALENALKATPAIKEALSEVVHAGFSRSAQKDKKVIAKLIWDTVDPVAAMDRAADSVARGNQKVYEEIARAFAGFVATCLEDGAYDAAKIDDFCNTLKPGDPPDGQQYLRQAFSHYYQAFFETDPKAMAELILMANLEIGFHEQTRLQPEITEALEAALEDPQVLKRRLLTALFPNRSWILALGDLLRALLGRPTTLDRAMLKLSTAARQRIRLFLTEHLMSLILPKEMRLRLGQDLKTGFPANLEQLTNSELIALLKKIDPTTDSLRESGAIDWADLPDRLHFIADLFRSYQEVADMLSPPFEAEQLDAIKANRLPAGAL